MTTTDDLSLYALQGHDRDCMEAMLSQARLKSSPIDDIQVLHLLRIGYTAGRAVTRDDTAFDRTDRRLGRLLAFIGGAATGALIALIVMLLSK